MRAVIPRPAFALAAAAALAACQAPDVGQRCTLETWQNASTRPNPTDLNFTSDYLETGNVACDNLVCIVSPVRSGKYSDCPGAPAGQPQLGQCGYCSKPCVSNQDCYPSQTGLECRQMVLDPAFIQMLRDQGLADKYLASVQFSSYCAVPLP
jgi:hypothetical protein